MSPRHASKKHRNLALLLSLSALFAAGCSTTGQKPESYTWRTAAVVASMGNPEKDPPGVNPASCIPTADKPPVVLVHGTFANKLIAWGGLGPYLAQQGRCVYALNYGARDDKDVFKGMAPVEESARQLAAFVEQVRQQTGAPKVDLIGHSQGGLLIQYYTKMMGGADKVHTLIAMAPSTRGTTKADQSTPKVAEGSTPDERYAASKSQGGSFWNCPACSDQRTDSPVITAFLKGPIAQPNVRHNIIATRQDKVVVPVDNQLVKEPGVNNIVLDDVFPERWFTHTNMLYNQDVWRLVEQTLSKP